MRAPSSGWCTSTKVVCSFGRTYRSTIAKTHLLVHYCYLDKIAFLRTRRGNVGQLRSFGMSHGKCVIARTKRSAPPGAPGVKYVAFVPQPRWSAYVRAQEDFELKVACICLRCLAVACDLGPAEHPCKKLAPNFWKTVSLTRSDSENFGYVTLWQSMIQRVSHCFHATTFGV